MAANGYSLHIGINLVNPDHYDGWSGELFGCENDAKVYSAIAQQAGFSNSSLLLTGEATVQSVLDWLKDTALQSQPGDLVLITYAGHGGTIPDKNNDETDGYDETWCLYDRQLIDDELFQALKQFKPGVKLLLFSDSCHSGTVSRNPVVIEMPLTLDINGKPVTNTLIPRQPPGKISRSTYEKHKDVYDPVLAGGRVWPDEVSTFVMLFAACQDNQTAKEWGENGLFTGTLKRIFNGQVKNYSSLFKEILKEIPDIQTPNLFKYGDRQFDFSDELPFSIDGNPFLINENTKIVTSEMDEVKDASIIIHASNTKGRSGPGEAPASPLEEKLRDEKDYGLKPLGVDNQKAWDAAYLEYFRSKKENSSVEFVEPNIQTRMFKPVKEGVRNRSANEYMVNWPKPKTSNREFVWHLDDDFSQLRKAADAVINKVGEGNAKVRIGHIDTGYLDHVSNPVHLLKELGVSFVKDEFGKNKGVDKLKSGFPAEQDGHGLATLAILAGNKVSKADSYGDYEGYFGAIPFAEVIPIRVCETVYNFFNANDVADGIDYAVDHGCDVVTMSMAGYPTRRVAEAVNRAYENGVVVVTAAGNNFVKGIAKISPKSVLYPARFDRVVAATGACSNHEPYDLSVNSWYKNRSEGGEFMQGNWGPQRSMKSAVAAYTPNLPWATTSSNKFLKSGGGTSSATPQVAAAMALWIAYNRDKLVAAGIDKSWKKVEAARKAVFRSASKSYPDYKKFYGNGIIRAFDALDNFDFDTELDSLKESEKASVGFGGVFQFLGQMFRGRAAADPSFELFAKDEGLREMVELEIVQLLYRDPELYSYCEAIEYEDEEGTDFLHDSAARKVFFEKIKASEFASEFLKSVLP